MKKRPPQSPRTAALERILTHMIKHFATLPSVYGKQDRKNVGVTAMRGLSLDWQDCLESFEDWWGLMQCSPQGIDTPRGVVSFFNLVGQPLDERIGYPTPWDEFLAAKQFYECLGGRWDD